MNQADHISCERQGPIAVVTLNRPEVLNAWTGAMRDDLVACIQALEVDSSVRAVVVTGTGARAFCAGQDLNEAKTFDEEDAEAWIESFRRFYGAVRELSKPIIAALNGVAAGSGFQFALLCDIRIAHPGVQLGQPEIRSGILSITGPWIMREVMGSSRTVEMALTGRLIDAEEAREAGIVHRIVRRDQVLPAAMALAQEMALLPQMAMQLDKAWLREMTQPGFDAAFAAALRYHRLSYASGEPQAASAEFLEGRRRG
jgi:enoyl-CoA hydratase